MGKPAKPAGPDLTQGIPAADLDDGGMLVGHVADDNVLVARRGIEVFAIDAACSHYSGPLAEGLMVEDTVHCPWHHARFSLRTGEALAPPALSALACWQVEQHDGRIFVTGRKSPAKKSRAAAADAPRRIVIVGGGAAGFAAAEKLRREGFAGDIAMLS